MSRHQLPAANLCRDGHVREGLQALVGRVPRCNLGPELERGLGDAGVVSGHLDGLGHATELLDHAFTKFARKMQGKRGKPRDGH